MNRGRGTLRKTEKGGRKERVSARRRRSKIRRSCKGIERKEG